MHLEHVDIQIVAINVCMLRGGGGQFMCTQKFMCTQIKVVWYILMLDTITCKQTHVYPLKNSQLGL